MRLQHALAVSQGRWQQQQLALRAADDQEGLGAFALAELSLERDERTCSERATCNEASELFDRLVCEESCVHDLLFSGQELQGMWLEVQHGAARLHTARGRRAAALAEVNAATRQLAHLRQACAEEGSALEHQGASLASRNRLLGELEGAIASATGREAEGTRSLKVKEQMSAHAREQLEGLRAAARRAEAQQRETQAAWNCRLAEGPLEERRRRAAFWEAAASASRREAAGLEHAVTQKDQALRYAEVQLAQLRAVYDERACRAQDQLKTLHDEGLRVLAQAREAADEIDRRFRAELHCQMQEHDALTHSLVAAQRRLAAAPRGLHEAQCGIALERGGSAERAAALLAALRR